MKRMSLQSLRTSSVAPSSPGERREWRIRREFVLFSARSSAIPAGSKESSRRAPSARPACSLRFSAASTSTPTAPAWTRRVLLLSLMAMRRTAFSSPIMLSFSPHTLWPWRESWAAWRRRAMLPSPATIISCSLASSLPTRYATVFSASSPTNASFPRNRRTADSTPDPSICFRAFSYMAMLLRMPIARPTFTSSASSSALIAIESMPASTSGRPVSGCHEIVASTCRHTCRMPSQYSPTLAATAMRGARAPPLASRSLALSSFFEMSSSAFNAASILVRETWSGCRIVSTCTVQLSAMVYW
mmetsp:Transcript_44438/g.90687  ORF Transcript_44438/g.90687 Transcript_44438/m.90687 type:complete len:302 (+) Transcript_44438:1500-2405(+)